MDNLYLTEPSIGNMLSSDKRRPPPSQSLSAVAATAIRRPPPSAASTLPPPPPPPPSVPSFSQNPFETKEKTAFPDFTASFHRNGEEEEKETLNWSIDTIAELKPMAFSPQPEQFATTNQSDDSSFFEDATRFRVLQTPSPLVTRQLTHDLHTKCQKAIQECEARVRERQEKMNRLALKISTKTKPNKPKQEKKAISTSTTSDKIFACTLSPIPTRNDESKHQILVAEDATRASFQSLQLSPSPKAFKEEDNKENDGQSQSDSFSRFQTMSLLHDTSECNENTTDKPLLSTAGAITKRQLSFMEAIEAASSTSAPSTPQTDKKSRPDPTPGSTTSSSRSTAPSSVVSAYKEAKAMGLREPSAQWEYAQIMRRSRLA